VLDRAHGGILEICVIRWHVEANLDALLRIYEYTLYQTQLRGLFIGKLVSSYPSWVHDTFRLSCGARTVKNIQRLTKGQVLKRKRSIVIRLEEFRQRWAVDLSCISFRIGRIVKRVSTILTYLGCEAHAQKSDWEAKWLFASPSLTDPWRPRTLYQAGLSPSPHREPGSLRTRT